MTTFVLIHGAYQGGWIWQPTAARLRAAGHLVYAPSLDGCGERRHSLRPGITTAAHATEVADLLFYNDLRDVTLAGTSAGGMVICRTAELARAYPHLADYMASHRALRLISWSRPVRPDGSMDQPRRVASRQTR